MAKIVQNVVFIDDDIHVLSALKRTLFGVLDAQCHFFSDSDAALEFIDANPVAVVVSDYRMPNRDGVQLLSEVQGRWPHIERVLLTGYADLEASIRAINKARVGHFLEKPWDNDHLIDVLRHSLAIAQLRVDNERMEATILKKNRALELCKERLEDRVLERTRQLTEYYHSTLRTFVSMVEMRLQGFQHRGSDVVYFCEQLALRQELDRVEQNSLLRAAMLRNIGKLTLTDDLIQCPFASLSGTQKTAFMRHPVLAHAVISPIEPLAQAAEILLTHKECLDGSGYPKALKGDQISTPARILAIVNDFFELIDGHMHEKPLSPGKALQHIESHAGDRYDSVIVAHMREQVADWMSREAPVSRCISVLGLQEGDVLVKDILTRTGLLVLARGKVIDGAVIAKLKQIETNLQEALDIYVTPEQYA